MSGNTHTDAPSTEYRMKTVPKRDNMEPSNSQKPTSHNVTSITTRPKKPPNSMLKDFFMVDCPHTHTRTTPEKTYIHNLKYAPVKVIHQNRTSNSMEANVLHCMQWQILIPRSGIAEGYTAWHYAILLNPTSKPAVATASVN